ncbi:MAG TPA: hypothetical protein VG650_11970 [Mycobacteriales bacterium]|nr:hypothetical protein [Mycobacteriales bacterium]
MRPQQLVAGAVLLAATAGAAGVLAATDAGAASCAAITVSAGQNLSFDVSSVYVPSGSCVRFANLTDVTVTIKVSGSSFSEKLPARTPATASASYTARKSATVTATDGVRSGQGRITVESGGTTTVSTPAPTQSTVVPPPAPSSQPSHSTASPTASSAAAPPGDVSTEAPAAVNSQRALSLPAVPVLPNLPPPPGSSSTAPPTASHPVVAPRVKPNSDPRLTSTVLEPASGSDRGLPATVAAVLLLGLAAAYGRTVLVAGEAVDRRPAPRPLRPTV